MADVPPESASHLRFARVWGMVALLGWAALAAGPLIAKSGAAPPTPLLSTAAGLILFAGALSATRGWRARCPEGYAWMAIAGLGICGFLALVLFRVVAVVP